MDVKEEMWFMFFNDLIETNCEGLIDWPVTGVNLLFWFSIVEIEFSGEISIKINPVLIFAFTFSFLSSGLISHSVSTIKNSEFHFVSDFWF